MRRLARRSRHRDREFPPRRAGETRPGLGSPVGDQPGLVMVRLSGFGQTGPMKDQPGFGAIGESMGGLRYVTGFADRPPVRTGISIGDSIAALWGVIGALMALRHREVKGGAGQVVDVALYEAMFAMMESMVPEFDVLRFRARTHRQHHARHHAVEHPYHARRQARDHRRQRRCDFQAPDDGDRPRTTWPTTRRWPATTGAMRGATRSTALIDAWVAQHDEADGVAHLQQPTCRRAASFRWRICSPTRNSSRAADARNRTTCLTASRFGCRASCPSSRPRRDRPNGSVRRSAQHTDEVLQRLGYPPEKIASCAFGAI